MLFGKIKMMKILKIGGSFITKKSGYREPDKANIRKAAKAVASLWKKGVRDFVLVHGAGSFGHALVLKYGINDGVRTDAQKLGCADTHSACAELSSLLVKALIGQGVPAIPIPPSSVLEQKGGRILAFNEAPVRGCLKSGFLPVLHGDMVPDSTMGASVCSGDQIVSYLGRGAEYVVLATNVDGVLDGEGKIIPAITSSNFSEISQHLKRREGDVTGAMEGKLRELLALETPSYIVNAAHPERILGLMLGKKGILCTEVRK